MINRPRHRGDPTLAANDRIGERSSYYAVHERAHSPWISSCDSSRSLVTLAGPFSHPRTRTRIRRNSILVPPASRSQARRPAVSNGKPETSSNRTLAAPLAASSTAALFYFQFSSASTFGNESLARCVRPRLVRNLPSTARSLRLVIPSDHLRTCCSISRLASRHGISIPRTLISP
jgi:hypothetical protein